MIAAAVLALGLALAPAPAPAAQPVPAARVVLVFVADPAWRAADAAVGALVPATGRSRHCPADMALTISAGRPAGLPGDECGAAPAWEEIVRANAARRHDAVPGTLAATVAAQGGCVSASGPLAELVARDRAGRLGAGCPVHVADLTGIPSLPEAVAAARSMGDAVWLVSLPPPGHLGGVARLGGSGLLRGTPGRAGLVTLADLTAELTGERPLATVPGDAADVAELVRREHLHRPYHGVFFTGVIALPMLLYIWLGFGRRRAGPRARAVALVLAAFPVAGFQSSLVPCRDVEAAWLAATLAVAAATAVVALAGIGAARLLRMPAEAGVALVTALVFAADLLTGGYLQETAIASSSAIAGGRFSGLGNAGFAVFATAAVVACGAAAARYGRAAWLGLVPVVALVAAPQWGADFGGAIALTAALVVALAVRARPVAVALGALAGLAIALGVAVADYARPAADRTHLGRFVGDVLHGGWSDTVLRKAGAAASSVLTWYPLLVAGSAVTAYVLLRRFRAPEPLVRALLVVWVLGSLVNDSGVVVAAAGMAVAVPLLVSYAERP